MGYEITTLVFVALAVILIARGVRMVPQGYQYTVERFGKYTRTLPSRPSYHYSFD